MSKLTSLVINGSATLDGPVFLVFERSAPWPDCEAAAVTEVVQMFVAAGERSAYPGPGVAPGQQDLELTGPAIIAGPNLGYWLRARQLDARAFQLVRHMVSRIEPQEEASLLRITAGISGPGMPPRTSLPVIDYENEAVQYPGRPARAGFAVVWDDEAPTSKARRVLVEMASPIAGPPVDAFIDCVRPWGALVESGAFTMPIGLPHSMDNVMDMITQFDALTLEIAIGVYRSSESGFDVLLHILSAYHLRERPIQQVTIE